MKQQENSRFAHSRPYTDGPPRAPALRSAGSAHLPASCCPLMDVSYQLAKAKAKGISIYIRRIAGFFLYNDGPVIMMQR
ncbi:MAG: hypothetical protein C0402_01095 [Thermodesulfovibrio sp.]|nr:hypothetical protein [Thermodesulfovibrio sp.]